MSELFILKNRYVRDKLARSFTLLSQHIDRCYKLHGETRICLYHIEKIVSVFCRHQINTQDFTAELFSAHHTEQYRICRLLVSKNLKVSLHIAPEGTKLPRHQHLGAINCIIPLLGHLSVTQYNDKERKTIELRAPECSVGLKQYFNQHSLHVLSPYCMFISFRYQPRQAFRIQQLKSELIYMLSFLLLPAFTSGSYASEISHSDCAELAELVSEDTVRSEAAEGVDLIVQKANKIRHQSENEDALYTAATLYETAASKDHPEAQYWLGYMLLQGIGITEDSDMALHWIAASSDQQYPPAQKLLDYILNNEPALDC